MHLLCINPKQAAGLLRVGERQAQRIFKAIRQEVNKKKRQSITIKEFSEYRGLDEVEVRNALK